LIALHYLGCWPAHQLGQGSHEKESAAMSRERSSQDGTLDPAGITHWLPAGPLTPLKDDTAVHVDMAAGPMHGTGFSLPIGSSSAIRRAPVSMVRIIGGIAVALLARTGDTAHG
jgi:hypothetical protein